MQLLLLYWPLFQLLSINTPGSLAVNGASLSVLTPNDCGTCLGHRLLYECTAVGTGITVWKGSAFLCPNNGNSILLSHRLFHSSGAMDACNGGAIVGYSLRPTNNQCYTSRLNVTVDASMNGQTIQCFYNNGSKEIEIGSQTITIRRDPFPLPNEVGIGSIHLDEDMVKGSITFYWSSVNENCSAIHYDLTAINCGTCPDITRDTQVTCHNVTIGNVCTFAVNTVACETIVRDLGSPALITATLKAPIPPVLRSVPLYSAEDGHLKSITTTFEEAQESVTTSDGIDGSATSFSIIYSDSRSGSSCGSTVLPSSDCQAGICSHVFQINNSDCPPCVDINITAFSTNLLGNGAISDVVTIGSINNLVTVKFDSIFSSIHCVFKQRRESEKSCSIVYGPRHEEHCAEMSSSAQSRNQSLYSTTVVIDDLHLQNGSQFCLIVTASDGSHTASIETFLHAGCNPQELSDGTQESHKLKCATPLHTLSIRNGVVCYDSTDVGKTAVYSCLSGCVDGSQTTLNMSVSVRTCLSNGSWTGIIPVCECDLMHFNSNIQVLATATATSIAVVFTTVIVIFTVIIIVLVREKSKIQVELKQLQFRTTALYEEIVIPQATIDSSKNVAYECVTKMSNKA